MLAQDAEAVPVEEHSRLLQRASMGAAIETMT
jgi:hypothetical protein